MRSGGVQFFRPTLYNLKGTTSVCFVRFKHLHSIDQRHVPTERSLNLHPNLWLPCSQDQIKSMPTIEPTRDIPLPYTEVADESDSFRDTLEVTANTIEVLEELGAPPEVAAEDALATAELLKKALKKQDIKALNNTAVAFGAREFVRTYSTRLAVEMSDIRTALTNKLLELANCGDPRFELKALELLGKHSDIALFTERSEVTVNYKNSTDLEGAIKDRIRRILHSSAVDVEPITPRADQLDDVFGPEKIRVVEGEVDTLESDDK
jgi:hypothetical protein